MGIDNQILACCGHTMIVDGILYNVDIWDCLNGIDLESKTFR